MKVYSYAYSDFVKEMQKLNWTDENLPKNAAVISILDANNSHYFKLSKNVLNINIDSIESCFTNDLVNELVEFIKIHYDCDFYIYSNIDEAISQSIVNFIVKWYENRRTIETRKNSNCNEFVFELLNNELIKKFDSHFISV